MKILYTLFLLFIFLQLPADAKDVVQLRDSAIDGKITSYSDGLIQIRAGGVDHSIVRSKNTEYYGDYIAYRERPILGGSVETYCRVTFVDNYKVTYKTKTLSATVPRYRVKSLVLQGN